MTLNRADVLIDLQQMFISSKARVWTRLTPSPEKDKAWLDLKRLTKTGPLDASHVLVEWDKDKPMLRVMNFVQDFEVASAEEAFNAIVKFFITKKIREAAEEEPKEDIPIVTFKEEDDAELENIELNRAFWVQERLEVLALGLDPGKLFLIKKTVFEVLRATRVNDDA